ncbi:hypothetical protein ASD78_07215 [Lysobacter sp. Root667]|uniref:DUF3426 domain-containing protein n=1 Tax=Lysobacter sp. Root667 TaxID=1736581 RepID=UPI0006F38D40|nr:DUF3426 domain-containing protein [Lysobacter sp. Root667]KRA75748.1 hypothetical protein ASD78_07215 [Lysobacter sp. Root667]
MFVACPHCGFLVALILPPAGTGARVAPQRCPRCERPLQADAAADTADATAEPDVVQSERDEAERLSADADSPAELAADDAGDVAAVVEATAEADTGAEPMADATAAVPSLEESIAASSLPNARTRPARPARAGRAKRDAPSFVRGTAAAPAPRRDWRAFAAIGALLLALALQLVLAQRQELAADARWRPLVGALCGVLRCSLPPWHEPAAYTMLGRNVRPSPGATGVLRVNASFRNDARWPQRWPTLLLTLSDVDGREVGQRAFAPSDYRRDHKPTDELAPGQSASVQLDVVEPAPHIVAFTFDFQ